MIKVSYKLRFNWHLLFFIVRVERIRRNNAIASELLYWSLLKPKVRKISKL